MTDLANVPLETNASAAPATQQEKPVADPKPAAQQEDTKITSAQVVKVSRLESFYFADIWYTPENVAYVRDNRTRSALIPIVSDDLEEFHQALEKAYTGSSSYALKFGNVSYRVERITTVTGIQYNCRRMPTSTPSLWELGLPNVILKNLTALVKTSGLILIGGPTGMGKTTTVSALLQEFLRTEGGFAYTIEDPPEMPMDGLYKTGTGALGLCKQTPVVNERWEDGLKSALRSKPRYILVGEIRTPETASQTLRAATSGHLVVSTIHANSVEDTINAIIKYAIAAGLHESLACDLLARGILAVVHQKLDGVQTLKPVLHALFANPNPMEADQMRMAIREGKVNLMTLMEAQWAKMSQGKPLFKTTM